MRKTIISAVLLIVLVLAACTQAAGTQSAVALAAQVWLAERLGVDIDSVVIGEVEHVEWNDGCLELGGPEESCLAAVTPGWRIVFEINGESYEIHTNEDGSDIRLAGDQVLLPAVVTAAQAWLAVQLGVEVENVMIQKTEQVEWSDGCLELGGPDESCLAAITPGWLIVFEVNGESYEVHTDEDGSSIRLKDA
jgi:hypothetical protein